jgi:predicted ABC-type ATPase
MAWTCATTAAPCATRTGGAPSARNPDIDIDRVRRRVQQGGHPVDDEKVMERHHQSIALMTRVCEAADRASIFGNAGSRHKLLAEVTDLETIELASSRINSRFLGTDLWQAFS